MTGIVPYMLLDAGEGRRLERFGPVLVDRPAPAAQWPRRDPDAWFDPDLRFERVAGWVSRAPAPVPWTVSLDAIALELRPTPAGQVGWFPEQLDTWRWVRARITERTAATSRPRVLNLFGYTGGATLVAASAGADVVHVEASRPTIAWARENAARSGLADASIRWIGDDVPAFLRREGRRGRRYEGIVLDPPSYGHGRGGETWRLETDLPPLLDACVALLGDEGFVALTSHTPGFGPDRLATVLARALGTATTGTEAGTLHLDAESGARLELGAYARWSA